MRSANLGDRHAGAGIRLLIRKTRVSLFLPIAGYNAAVLDHVAEPANSLVGEIKAEAEQRRVRDPELARIEQEIGKVWVRVVANHAKGPPANSLLEQVEGLAFVNVDAAVGGRRSIRQAKRAVRKVTRWYLRHLTDQVNSFNNFLCRLVREMDQRLAGLEKQSLELHQGMSGVEKQVLALDQRMSDVDSRLSEFETETRAANLLSGLAVSPPEADTRLAEELTLHLSAVEGSVAVVSCGTGGIVAALCQSGICAHGVDVTAAAIEPGATEGLDLRVAPLLEYLGSFSESTLAAVVLTREIEHKRTNELLELLDEAIRCVAHGGMVVVAVADPNTRTGPTAEVLRGCGFSPALWAVLLGQRGCAVETIDVAGSRVDALVLARTP